VSRTPTARLVCVGSELLAGQVNTHQAWLSTRLRRAGFEVLGEQSVSDSVAEIRAALARALASADAVIVCGGLGPTFDDLTREGAAAALRRPLRFDAAQWRIILGQFARRGMTAVPEQNRRQAEVLKGAASSPRWRRPAPRPGSTPSCPAPRSGARRAGRRCRTRPRRG
jgi:nicotinamide-nucleotide amidase